MDSLNINKHSTIVKLYGECHPKVSYTCGLHFLSYIYLYHNFSNGLVAELS
jgi:hypothetical protein